LEPKEYKRFEFQYGLVLLRTRRFQSLMDRLGASRVTKSAGWVFLYLLPVAAAIGFYLFLSELGVLLSPRGTEVISYVRGLSPLANLGLPGINPYLPIVDGWIALVIGMIVHEGAHGVVARSLGLPVKAAGLIFLLIVPIGAFVDVDETALRTSRSSYSGRVLAAGAGINLIVGVLCLLLLVGVVTTMKPASQQGIGVVVADNSPLAKAGVQTYDYLLAVNGAPISDVSSIATSSWYQINNTVTLTVWRDGTTFQRNVTIGSQLFQNITSGQTFKKPFIGLSLSDPSTQGVSGLQSVVSSYAGAALNKPFAYVCIPTLPACQGVVPFSDSMSGFYTSSFGPATVPLANILYWVFFLNFNLAIFNALPIYPLDGGQAFLVGVKALGRGRLNDATAMRITSIVTLAVVLLIFGIIAGPYLF
jgi:membrane-associated protease RseP (regulator of RpoE activity)